LNKLPIIDLFAGPGGLGEGFSALRINSLSAFKIVLSIEKDPYAHKTLQLRSFYRQFICRNKEVPPEYYDYLEGEITRKELFSLYKSEAQSAEDESWLCELGSEKYPNNLIYNRIRMALRGNKDFVLIGGPPCQAYSLVGRSRMIGGQRNANNGDISKFEQDHRHILYRQYLRIIAEHSPAVFVMENVKGILSSKLDDKPIFPEIIKDLKEPWQAATRYDYGKGYQKSGYRILSFATGKEPDDYRDFMIKSEQYGIPQARHRVILLGIREDIYDKRKSNITALKKKDSLSLKNVLGDIPALRSGISKDKDSCDRWSEVLAEAVKEKWFKELDSMVEKEIGVILDSIKQNPIKERINKKKYKANISGWFKDECLRCLPNHSTRSHMKTDLHRYLFASIFAKVNEESPDLSDFPLSLLPNHKNVMEGVEGKTFGDRFKVQVWHLPSTTVTSHIAKDGHYFIHPDPLQCRSLTVREAARLQTFPDNYYFEGNRTQQYHQVGNAVPPLLAYQLSEVVHNILRG